MARFLFTRGLWLIFIEVVVINMAWFYEPGWSLTSGFLLFQVIWALGWSMIFLAGLVFLPITAIAVIGFAIVFGHNLADGIRPEQWGELSWIWSFLHVSSYEQVFPNMGMIFAYPVVPWIGVMALGYLFGAILQKPAEQRDRLCLQIGTGAVGLFLLVTLGPVIALLPLMETVKGNLVDIFTIFGRVPFFFYILHLYLIHLSTATWVFMTFDITNNSLNWGFFGNFPDAYSPSLLRAYVAWILTLLAMYWPCKWFVGIRRRHKQWWLSYL